MTIVTLGLDLGKNWVHMVGFDGEGRIELHRRIRRQQLLVLTSNMPACLIGMEACSGAHHLGRALEVQGHTARLMPPQYVKPFVKANKNDYRDAEANAEAVQRPTMNRSGCGLRRLRETSGKCEGRKFPCRAAARGRGPGEEVETQKSEARTAEPQADRCRAGRAGLR